jgi:hypothetical protein
MLDFIIKLKKYICVQMNLFLFLLSNIDLYRVDKDFNFYKLKTKTQFTFNLFYDVSSNYGECLNYFYTNNLIKCSYFYNISLNLGLFLKLKSLILDKLLLFNYFFFEYNGFEFLDVILDNRNFMIIKKTEIDLTFTCFLFFDKIFDTFIKEFNLNNLNINKYMYYNNLSFDFFLYLGLFLNKLTKPKYSLLQVSLFFHGSTQTVKTNFLTSLFQALFGSEKDVAFNLGTTKDFSSFKTQLLDKNIL